MYILVRPPTSNTHVRLQESSICVKMLFMLLNASSYTPDDTMEINYFPPGSLIIESNSYDWPAYLLPPGLIYYKGVAVIRTVVRVWAWGRISPEHSSADHKRRKVALSPSRKQLLVRRAYSMKVEASSVW